MSEGDRNSSAAGPAAAGPKGWLSHRRLPYLSRTNYLHELRASMTFPLAAAMAEGSFASVVAQKYFGASSLLIAVIVAAPMFGNILALVWADSPIDDRRSSSSIHYSWV